MPEVLVEIMKSNLLESAHMGSIAVATSQGRVLYKIGDCDRKTYFHSSAKPIQGIAVLETGIADEFGLDLKEIALMISSHSGETEHLKTLYEMMKKIGVCEDELECGIAEPVNKEVLKDLYLSGGSLSRLHCNCSGKHLGFIAASKKMRYPLEGYHLSGHPIQKSVKKVLADFACVEQDMVYDGIDGCSVPVFAIPLKNMAQAYANLCNPDFFEGKYAKSQNYITSAMTMYPEMIAGSDRIDTELMKLCGARVIGKMGAEGVYCAGILEKGIGVAIKIEDGSPRAVSPVIIEVLLQLEVITHEEAGKLKEFWHPILKNNKGEATGEMCPVFRIH